MRQTVYIETTIPSYYFDARPTLEYEIKRTKEWWESERFIYDLITSELVMEE